MSLDLIEAKPFSFKSLVKTGKTYSKTYPFKSENLPKYNESAYHLGNKVIGFLMTYYKTSDDYAVYMIWQSEEIRNPLAF